MQQFHSHLQYFIPEMMEHHYSRRGIDQYCFEVCEEGNSLSYEVNNSQGQFILQSITRVRVIDTRDTLEGYKSDELDDLLLMYWDPRRIIYQ